MFPRKATYKELEQRVKELEKTSLEHNYIENTLKSERDKLKMLIDGLASTGIGVDIVSNDYEVIQQNQALIDRFGDVAGKKCYTAYMALVAPCNPCPMVKALKNKRLEKAEMRAADGRYYEIFSAPLTNPDGSVDKTIEVVLDITDRKQIENIVKKNRAMLEAVINSLPFDVFALDPNSRYFLQNPICKNHWGDLIGKCPEDLAVNKETLNLWLNNNQRAFSGETVADEVEYQSLEGKKHHYYNIISPIRDEDKYFGILGVLVDISNLKQVERALQQSESKLSAMLESISDHMSMIDKDLNIIWANKIAEERFGNDIIGKKCYKVYQNRTEPCEPYPCITLRAFEDRKIHDHYTQMIDKDGQTKFFHCTANIALKDKEGNPVSVLEVSRDITKSVRTENALNISLKEREVLLNEIHHRVKNNFQIISSLIDLSSMKIESRKNQKLFSDIRSRIYSMALIHTLLYEDNKFAQIDMEQYLRKLKDYMLGIYGSSEKSINFVIEAPGICLSVNQAIPSALALNEIIANSFKHAFNKSKHGTISVCIKDTAGDTILISLKDDGSGIPKGVDFNKTQGVGLKLASHLIEGQLRGKMHVNPNDGTEICIEFKKIN